jgi:hypothetical protein
VLCQPGSGLIRISVAAALIGTSSSPAFSNFVYNGKPEQHSLVERKLAILEMIEGKTLDS